MSVFQNECPGKEFANRARHMPGACPHTVLCAPIREKKNKSALEWQAVRRRAVRLQEEHRRRLQRLRRARGEVRSFLIYFISRLREGGPRACGVGGGSPIGARRGGLRKKRFVAETKTVAMDTVLRGDGKHGAARRDRGSTMRASGLSYGRLGPKTATPHCDGCCVTATVMVTVKVTVTVSATATVMATATATVMAAETTTVAAAAGSS